jgi:prefoldin alpha subunit
MENQELLMHAQLIEKKSQELNSNFEMIEKQILELNEFSSQLETLANSKEKEILSSLGKGVHIKADLQNQKELFVEVGSGVIVKKTPQETQKIIQEQLKKLNEAKLQVKSGIEECNQQMLSLFAEIQKLKAKSIKDE